MPHLEWIGAIMRRLALSIAIILLAGCGGSDGPTESTEDPGSAAPGSRYVSHRLLPVGAEVDLAEAGQVLEFNYLSTAGSVEYDEAEGVIRCMSGGAGCARLQYRDNATQDGVQTQCFVCVDETGDCGSSARFDLDLESFLEGGLPGDGNYLSQGDQLFYGICRREGTVVLEQANRALPPLMLRLVDAYGADGAGVFGEEEIPLGRQTRLTTYSGATLDFSSFLLDEGPDFIELNPNSGELTFRPEPRHASTHTVTVRVKNGQGGVDVIGFDLVVTA